VERAKPFTLMGLLLVELGVVQSLVVEVRAVRVELGPLALLMVVVVVALLEAQPQGELVQQVLLFLNGDEHESTYLKY